MSEFVSELQKILDHFVASGEECGCQLAVFRHGKNICNLCAGHTSPERHQKVTTDTLFPIFSVGKGVVTTLLLILAEKGKLSFDDPVVKYWPEFGCCGKEETTIRNLLSHRAGLWKVPDSLTFNEWFDWEKIVKALAEATPEDKIGGIHHYHAHTYGVLVGHVAELADGRPFNQLLQEEILTPLQIKSLFFGLPASRCQDLAPVDDSVFSDFRVDFNRFCVLTGLNPSSNGCANAESLAMLYASLIEDGLNSIRLLKPETIENATKLCRSEDDIVKASQWDKFGLGYALIGPSDNLGRTFGHGGACGAEGFADKQTGYAVGFTKNKLNATHPDHPVRNAISDVLGIPHRIW